MPNTLVPGQVRVGHLFLEGRHVEGPVCAAALTFDDHRGAQLLVPYLRTADRHAQPQAWFEQSTPPEALAFADNEGWVILLGVRWGGQSGSGFVTGRLTAQTAIFGEPRTLRSTYRVRTMRSSIDGLDGFTHFRPVKYAFPARGEPAVITLDDSESVSWRSQGYTYEFRAGAVWSGAEGRRFEAESLPFLATTCHKGRTPQEHLRAQWAVRDLLLLAHGEKLAWRTHHVADEEFPLWTMDGKAHGPEPAETHFAGTVREHAQAQPSSIDLAFPALNLRALGSRGLKRWTDMYADDMFRRAVQPVAEVINGAARFLEPQLMMLASALDYFGYYRFGDSCRRELQESIRRCLDGADLDFPQIGSREGIARAIGRLNNDLKHPDRERRPEGDELACIVNLAKIIARAQPFDLVGAAPSAKKAFLESRDVRWATELFERCGLRVADDGSITRRAETDADESASMRE
ncbi:hypothetical protein [Actinotalea fermentans]|uniref:Uncharacterized protein n=1 Tax=Actinotalea fermentans TaxID=43671 RepID=A0A511YUY5_9CELL|nr:hypothetical protein [Actinotalea fermentans]KGM17899.1 hypothetical protein N867_00165 [Actinotalea fermentans ATCC 43279 = JCM 9966 = DSM 3133]GEN79005.1 hypothetical protein AFE02nite_07390 [Actinotalea fermentans]